MQMYSKQATGKTRTAFTLVELLVVVAIIALLISVLLPALNKAKATAQEVVCRSQLHTQGMAMVSYQAEWQGAYPYLRSADDKNYNDKDKPRPWWQTIHNTNTAPGAAVYCPTDINTPKIDHPDSTISYGYNYKMAMGFDGYNGGSLGGAFWQEQYARMKDWGRDSNISRASETLILADVSESGRGFFRLNWGKSGGGNGGVPQDRHNNFGANVLWADAHASVVHASDNVNSSWSFRLTHRDFFYEPEILDTIFSSLDRDVVWDRN